MKTNMGLNIVCHQLYNASSFYHKLVFSWIAYIITTCLMVVGDHCGTQPHKLTMALISLLKLQSIGKYFDMKTPS